MPWVRIDENALTHIKVQALSDGAFRLWVEGLAHCQRHLTDGAISRTALRTFRYGRRNRVEELTRAVDGSAPLWEIREDGFMVHDYLSWNESREHVLKARELGRNRIKRLRARRSDNSGASNPVGSLAGNALRTDGVTVSPLSGVECTYADLPTEGESTRGERRRSEPPTLPGRAGMFCEWYADTHERLFQVAYIGTNSDYLSALKLVEKMSDSDLRDAALVWFGQDDNFATQGTRSIPKFASRATGCLQQARAVVGRPS